MCIYKILHQIVQRDSMDLSVPTILWSRVRIQSILSMLFQTLFFFVIVLSKEPK